MKKLFAFLLTLALSVTCMAGIAAVAAEDSVALPDYYRTCLDDFTTLNCAGTPQKEDGVRYLHIIGDEGTTDAYFFPENGWGPTLDHPVLLFKYRSAGGFGQFFFTTPAIAAGETGTYIEQEFPASGTDWQYLVYDFSDKNFACFNEDANKVSFFRIDLNAIEWMDYSYVAFFKTADEANAFAEAEKAGKVTLFDDTKVTTIKYTVSPRSMDPKTFTGHDSTAIEFTVPDGYSFKAFVLTAAPTWGTQENANLDATIFAWNKDYDTTIEGIELGSFREECHADNMNLVMDFGVILPPGKYVIYITAEDDTIGAWGGNMDEINYDAIFYFDDMEDESWFPYSEILLVEGTDLAIELPTPAPTAEPTEKPTAAPTAEHTAAPTAVPVTDVPSTEAAKPTDNAGNKDSADNTNKGLSTGALIGIIAGAVAVAVAVAAVIVAKGKKKK